MSNQILIKKGLEANRLGITPSGGELIWTTDDHQLYVGDGSTPGGISVTERAAALYIPLTQKAQPDGVATLGPSGLIPSNQLPPIEVGQVDVVDTLAEMYLLVDVNIGDVCVVTGTTTPSEAGNFIARTASSPSTSPIDPNEWIHLASPIAPVDSVNGQTGTVVLTTQSISENTNLYFTDARAQNSANLKIQSTINDTAGLGDTDLLWSADKIAQAIGAGVVRTLEGLDDTDTTGAVQDDCLKFIAGKWTNVAPNNIEFSLGELTNVDTGVDTAPNGQVIIRQAGNYVATTLTAQDSYMTGYVKPANTNAIVSVDSIDTAIGKLEKGLEDATAGGGDVNVQSDWLQADNLQDDFIKNKPDLTAIRIGDLANVPEFAVSTADAGKIFQVDPTGQAVAFVDTNTVGRTTLLSLDDTNVTLPSDGDVLTWDQINSKWVNLVLPVGVSTLAALTDTTVTGMTPGQHLTWSGSSWTNTNLPTLVTTLEALTDTDITAPATGEYLRYNATTGWENSSLPAQVTTFIGLTDTPNTYGTAGKFLQINATQDGVDFIDTIDGGGF